MMRFIFNRIEEILIAVLLGLMTLVTFVNVVLRYGFNDSLIWGLEITLVLFAWLVLLGSSYCVKIRSHIGVDIVLNLVSNHNKRILGLVSAIICISYSLLLLKGAWDFWAPFAGLYETTGRWFPTGIDWQTRDRAWYETDQIPMVDLFRFLEPLVNQGEEYEKIPRMLPYVVLPISAILLVGRLIQAGFKIWNNSTDSLIVAHELQNSDTDSLTVSKN